MKNGNYEVFQQLRGSVTKKYWEELNNEKFMFQKCDDCHSPIFYARVVCPECMSENLSWHQAAGTGKIYSFSTVYRTGDSRFKSETPYVIGLIDLDEGIRVMANIIGWDDPEQLKMDQKVTIEYKKISEEFTLPIFRVGKEVEEQ